MKIGIEVVSKIKMKIKLVGESNTNDNGTETIYSGESEVEFESESITINALLQRNHVSVNPDDIELSENIQTTREEIAEQINGYLNKNL